MFKLDLSFRPRHEPLLAESSEETKLSITTNAGRIMQKHTPAQPSIPFLTGSRATAYPHTPVHMRNLSTLGLVMVIQGPLSPLLSFWLCLFVTAAYVSWCSLCHGYGITASLETLVFLLLMQDSHTCFPSPLSMC